MSKIVVDTSVLVSALIGKTGPAREVLRQCLLGNYLPMINTTLFLEYEDVSKRPRILQLCPLTPDEIRRLLNTFYNVCEWIQVHYLWRPNLKDEGDNFLIELAVASNATCIVTNNTKDLIYAELTFENLQILKPEQLLKGK